MAERWFQYGATGGDGLSAGSPWGWGDIDWTLASGPHTLWCIPTVTMTEPFDIPATHEPGWQIRCTDTAEYFRIFGTGVSNASGINLNGMEGAVLDGLHVYDWENRGLIMALSSTPAVGAQLTRCKIERTGHVSLTGSIQLRGANCLLDDVILLDAWYDAIDVVSEVGGTTSAVINKVYAAGFGRTTDGANGDFIQVPDGGGTLTIGDLTIQNCTIAKSSRNKAGIIYNGNSTAALTVKNTTFRQAGSLSGTSYGILARSGQSVIVEDCSFIGPWNFAIWVQADGGTPGIIGDSVFSGLYFENCEHAIRCRNNLTDMASITIDKTRMNGVHRGINIRNTTAYSVLGTQFENHGWTEARRQGSLNSSWYFDVAYDADPNRIIDYSEYHDAIGVNVAKWVGPPSIVGNNFDDWQAVGYDANGTVYTAPFTSNLQMVS